MAISESGFQGAPFIDARETVIEIVPYRPSVYATLATPVQPGQVVGYFNIRTGYVELFVGSATGENWIEVG